MTFETPPTIVVHGGAWAIPDSLTQPSRLGVQRAARLGHQILLSGGSSLDAIEVAIRELESNPVFDAGRGSCLTSAGSIEMDAALVTEDLEYGGVLCISNALHPISIARRVMQDTPHCLLSGAGADAFVKECDGELASLKDLETDDMRAEWKQFQRFEGAVEELFNGGAGHDTVGAVARDCNGVIAAGTSTGGITGKRTGRVGDSALVGAGLACEKGVGGVSTTGHGESILKWGLARRVLGEIERGGTVHNALGGMKKRTGGCGGAIAVDWKGDVWVACNTTRMSWAAIGADGEMKSGVERGEHV